MTKGERRDLAVRILRWAVMLPCNREYTPEELLEEIEAIITTVTEPESGGFEYKPERFASPDDALAYLERNPSKKV
jgi:hypothetical protein